MFAHLLHIRIFSEKAVVFILRNSANQDSRGPITNDCQCRCEPREKEKGSSSAALIPLVMGVGVGYMSMETSNDNFINYGISVKN